MEEFDLTRKQVRKMIIALVGVLALLTTISVYAVENKENTETSVYELGKLIRTQVQTEKLEDEADPQEKSIYAKGNNIEITQEERRKNWRSIQKDIRLGDTARMQKKWRIMIWSKEKHYIKKL